MVFSSRKINDTELLTVFFTTNEPSIDEVKELVTKSADLFVNKYGSKVAKANEFFNPDDYEAFTTDLLESGAMNRNPMDNISPLIKVPKKKRFIFF